ncbi:Aspartate aminotransferase [Pseudomonas sp. AD21]|uniref:pyridoxal phosphate-dependent aminotransferase n=1 Tax=Pseudomonas sp. AD21 TaxID=396378 RepID=UPI000C85C357|nr:pyridoxal phosphate-dependent aminotransferase [Pseudomonas sp. AD21]PMQ11566.1 Aspartate aminotransferase [Pseudomonas sp. AD21]
MSKSILTKRLSGIQPPATLTLSTKAAQLKSQGRQIVNMAVGEPDFDTPQRIRAAAIEAMNNGQTRYTPTPGTLALRQAIVAKLKRENGLSYTPEQIVVSSGAKQALNNVLSAIVEDGDEVIIPTPYWVSYADMVAFCGGVVVPIECPIEQSYRLKPEQLRAKLGPRVKAIMLNSPSNPSGAMYSLEELVAIGDVIREFPNVIVISDDIYEHVLVSDKPMLNLANACPDLADRVVVVNGVSKAYAMTGWRIGYSASLGDLHTSFELVQAQTTGPINAIAQAAAIEALNHSAELVAPMASAYRERHTAMCAALKGVRGIDFIPSEGSFYLFVKVEEAIEHLFKFGLLKEKTDMALSHLLLDQEGLAVVPGSAFGSPGYLRLSFAASLEEIEEACVRLKRICQLQ